jgi:hypothetical protein
MREPLHERGFFFVAGTLNYMRTEVPCEQCGESVNLSEEKHVHRVTGFFSVDKKGRPIKMQERVDSVTIAYHWYCWNMRKGAGVQDSMF